MKKKFKATIILPDSYPRSQFRYPVIYLLHGYSGNHSTWTDIVPLKSYADSYEVVFVCPDGDYNSWYIDSPIREDSEFMTYIAKEVVPFVDAYYRTWDHPDGRVIIGSSMGGHGALTILAEYPELFCGAGSISGIMDLTEFPKEWGISRILGSYSKNKERWYSHSFVSVIEKLRGKKKGILLDCGTGDFALKGNRQAHSRLLENSIDHDYAERPGDHSWKYVQHVFEYHLLYFSRLLKTAN